jgi:hypothetical protein
MKKYKLKIASFLVFVVTLFGFNYNMNSCPTNYELEQAAYLPTSRGLVLHCDMAGLEVCCKMKEPKEPKRLN